MRTDQPVLVTGGTGATGGFTIDALTKFDVSIRAIVPRDDERLPASIAREDLTSHLRDDSRYRGIAVSDGGRRLKPCIGRCGVDGLRHEKIGKRKFKRRSELCLITFS
jgi:hypothetical protein